MLQIPLEVRHVNKKSGKWRHSVVHMNLQRSRNDSPGPSLAPWRSNLERAVDFSFGDTILATLWTPRRRKWRWLVAGWFLTVDFLQES